MKLKEVKTLAKKHFEFSVGKDKQCYIPIFLIFRVNIDLLKHTILAYI